jgi:histidine ammonia-lyase
MIGLTGKRLTPEEVVAVARGDEEVELAAEAREAMAEGAAIWG